MKILLTGSTGFIGRRLKVKFLKDKNISLRLLVRCAEKGADSVNDLRKKSKGIEIVEGDPFNLSSLRRACKGIDTAYYLIPAMAEEGDSEKLSRTSAENFRDICIESGVKRIVYLEDLGTGKGGFTNPKNRIKTGEILSAYPERTQTIRFRTGVIIGGGSVCFEIAKHIVERLPVMIAPKWLSTKTVVIGIEDVLSYLIAAKSIKYKKNLIVDIGSEAVSFADILNTAAEVFGLKRHIIPLPFFLPKISSWWMTIFTPVDCKIASAFVDGLRTESVKQNRNGRIFFPEIKPASLKKALSAASDETVNCNIISRWCDSTRVRYCDISGSQKIPSGILYERREVITENLSPEAMFKSFMKIGGSNGWFGYDFLWIIRGGFDKLIGGCGLNRGRRDPKSLRIGDSLDFWKVADIDPGKRLLLYSQMKLPGRAWLEFTADNKKLIQTAYFEAWGLAGKIYWYLMLPFHILIFGNMAREIVRRAKVKSSG